MNTTTIHSQHGPAGKCIITPRGEYLSLEPVRCRDHGAGPWCRKMGKGEHLPIRPVLEAVLEEVNRQLPRFPQGQRLAIRRFGYPEDDPGDPDALEVSLGGNDPRREGKRAGRMIQHVLREWFPRTLDLHGEAGLAGRARLAAESGDRTFFQHAWKEVRSPERPTPHWRPATSPTRTASKLTSKLTSTRAGMPDSRTSSGGRSAAWRRKC